MEWHLPLDKNIMVEQNSIFPLAKLGVYVQIQVQRTAMYCQLLLELCICQIYSANGAHASFYFLLDTTDVILKVQGHVR